MTIPLDGLLLFLLIGTFTLIRRAIRKSRTSQRRDTVPEFDRPFHSLEELHQSKLNNFEKMSRLGAPLGIPAAADYCAEHSLVAPAWLTNAAAEWLCSTLRNGALKKRDRACGIMARYRQDMIDFARWDEVDVIREQQRAVRKKIKTLRKQSKIPRHVLNEQEELLNQLGHTLDDAFAYASKRLEKTNARGRWDTMRRSYRRVEKAHKDPKNKMRYPVFSHRFLSKIGLKAPLDLRQR
jgi:hypothetical protein